MSVLEVGGYAWARMGFNFASGGSTWYADAAKDIWKRNTNAPFPKGVYTAYEIAALRTPNGVNVGKEVLLGTFYSAVKYLDPKHETWKAGQAYYRSKSKKKKKSTY